VGRAVTFLDDYVDRVLAGFELDDARRPEVERELRAHLDEAVATRMQRGLSREEAEREAAAAFGQSGMLAGMFVGKAAERWRNGRPTDGGWWSTWDRCGRSRRGPTSWSSIRWSRPQPWRSLY